MSGSSAQKTLDPLAMKDKASAAALATKTPDMIGIVVFAEASGSYVAAERFDWEFPAERTAANARIYEDSARMLSRQKPADASGAKQMPMPTQRLESDLKVHETLQSFRSMSRINPKRGTRGWFG